MSQEKLDRIKAFLTSEGFIEGDTFRLSAGEYDTIELTVDVPIEPFELPEELKPYEQDPDQVERAVWKGNTEKKTWTGANFEMALRAYAGEIMERDPEAIALSARVDARDDSLTYEEWETQRKAIWARICSEPKIAAWETELNARHF